MLAALQEHTGPASVRARSSPLRVQRGPGLQPLRPACQALPQAGRHAHHHPAVLSAVRGGIPCSIAHPLGAQEQAPICCPAAVRPAAGLHRQVISREPQRQSVVSSARLPAHGQLHMMGVHGALSHDRGSVQACGRCRLSLARGHQALLQSVTALGRGLLTLAWWCSTRTSRA